MSASKKVLVALPEALLEKVDGIAEAEHRTRSDLIREALRRYTNEFADRGARVIEMTRYNNGHLKEINVKTQ